MYQVASIARWAMYLCIGGWAAACLMMTRLPSRPDIQNELYNQPIQVPVQQENFYYTYKGQAVTVAPVAEYTVWGLVVSQNDPNAWYRFDLSHDQKSPDTKDLCIIWGGNLKHDDYRRISFHNDDWWCGWKYGRDVKFFSEAEASNNHLITDSDAIRAIIKNVHVGDQVVIKGRLANYTEERWHGRFRHSSVSREDKGTGACEIVFVHDLVVLRSHNQLWSRLRDFFLAGAIAIAAFRLILFFTGPDSRKFT